MEGFFRQNLASLKGGEAKLVLTLFTLGDLTSAELKRLSGVRDDKTFYDALRRLQEAGWVDRLGKSNWKIQENLEKPSGKTQVSLEKPSEYPAPSLEYPSPVYLEKPSALGKSKSDTLENPSEADEVEDPLDRPVDMETAIARADMMDASGDERQPKSPFQIRRRRQLQLIHMAWTDAFGEDLNNTAAKELLQEARSQAQDVYDAIKSAEGRRPQYPLSYVRATIKNQVGKRESTNGAVLGTNRPVTDQTRREWEANDKLAQATYLKGWSL